MYSGKLASLYPGDQKLYQSNIFDTFNTDVIKVLKYLIKYCFSTAGTPPAFLTGFEIFLKLYYSHIILEQILKIFFDMESN
jgi:hypothetical protein